MGVICGLIYGYGPSKIAKEFGEGAKGIVVGCLIIGIARTVEVILSDAHILDTIGYGASGSGHFLYASNAIRLPAFLILPSTAYCRRRWACASRRGGTA